MRTFIHTDRNNKLHLMWTGFFIGMSTVCHAQPVEWQVQPKVCIVKDKGDACELQLSIETQGLPEGEYCFFQNDSQIQCVTSLPVQATFTVTFSESTELQLRNANGDIVLSHNLEIKARQSDKGKRRVRQPWSLF